MQTGAEDIRRMMAERYGIDLQEKITKIEFVMPEKGKAYFHIYDKWRPQEEEKQKQLFQLHICEGEDVRVLQFGSLETLVSAFGSFQRMNKYKLTATVDGKAIQRCVPEKR